MAGTSLLAGAARATSPSSRAHSAPPAIQPLSPERYRIQLLASGELKRKLELARDLLRHSLPSADLPDIVERALDLLLERTMKRRFAAKACVATGARSSPPEPSHPDVSAGEGSPSARTETDCPPSAERRGLPARYIPSAVRRIVIARDGAPDTVTCGAGTDRVNADNEDRVARDCERVAKR